MFARNGQEIFSVILTVQMTTTQMATGLSRRQTVRPSSALAEMVFLQEILTTLSLMDPLHARITTLFADESESLANDTWNQEYEEALRQARQRVV